MFSRRSMIKLVAGAGATLLYPLDRMVGRGGVFAQGSTGVELWGDFVLLDDGIPIPSFVQSAAYGPPIMCGSNETNGLPSEANAVTSEFATIQDLDTAFSYDLYELSPVPPGAQVADKVLIAHQTGEQYEAQITYESFDSVVGDTVTTLSICARPNAASPFPLWNAIPTESGDSDYTLEKITYTPTLGVRINPPCSLTGVCESYTYFWAAQGVLYELNDSFSPNLAASISLVGSLALV